MVICRICLYVTFGPLDYQMQRLGLHAAILAQHNPPPTDRHELIWRPFFCSNRWAGKVYTIPLMGHSTEAL